MITLMMPTYKRNDFLLDPEHPTINLVKSNLIEKIILIWQNVGEPAPSSLIDDLRKRCRDKLSIVYPEKNSLNNRFYNYDIINTDAVISIDDDYTSTISSIEAMYNLWNENKDTLVGCVPRYINPYFGLYTGGAARLESKVPFNFLLTGYAMFHRKYLDLYWENKDALNIVDKNMNSEDIYFNFMHYKHCQQKRIYVHDEKVKTWKMDPNGLARQKDHLTKRFLMFDFLVQNGYQPPRYDNDRLDLKKG